MPLSDRSRRATERGELHTFALPSRDGDGLAGGAKTITVRLADCNGARSTAAMLVNRKYSWRGYGAKHRLPETPNCITFTASSGPSLIGTLSLTVDSPAGLSCDKTFKDELDRFRAVPGSRLCELTKFAFDTSKPSLDLLASLFHIIFIYGTHHYDCTDLFIEVNPRHRRFYEAMLGFQPVGPVRINGAVAAPSHLMRLKVSDIRRQIDAQAGEPSAGSHSLYRYFFSRQEEEGIYARLASERSDPMPHVNDWDRGPAAAGTARFRREAAPPGLSSPPRNHESEIA